MSAFDVMHMIKCTRLSPLQDIPDIPDIHIIHLTTKSCWEDGVHQENSKVRFFCIVLPAISQVLTGSMSHANTHTLCLLVMHECPMIIANTKQAVSEEVVWLKLN